MTADFMQPILLGQTGLKVGRLGVAASYGAPASAFEAAFERGCNYFYWGSQRKQNMRQAIKNLCGQGKRDDLVILLQSYSRSAFLMERFFDQGLKNLGLAYADVLLLGWYNRLPSARILDRALDMKKKGKFRYLAVSGHKRTLFPQLAEHDIFDIFHIRYNAAHRGAETDAFALLKKGRRPGIVTYTATRWGKLLNPAKMPPGETPPTATDCYRFALSHPSVDVCMCGPKDEYQMQTALKTLDMGPLDENELARMQRIGDHVHR